MTLEERYKLSCYEDVLKLYDTKNIWLVRHNEEGTLYIKKIMELFNKEVYLRLMKERMENIPQIMLCIEDEDRLIVIEEYIHGSSLKKLMDKQGVFQKQQMVQCMLSLCQTVEKLHKSSPPIIHRDIKPSNIMISNDGIVKLIDFNAAKEVKSAQDEDTRLMGTQKFAAPEQYGFGQSDQRTDIYAIGVTMHYLLTGAFPQEGVAEGRLGKVIKKCTSIDKNNRYQKIEELRADLLIIEESLLGQEVDNRGEVRKETVQKEEIHSEAEKNKLFLTKNLYTYKEYFPIGFRSGVLWKMITAVYGYLFIFWMAVNLEVTSKDGIVVTGYRLVANRLAAFVMLMGTVFFIGNYCGIQEQFPLMKKNRILDFILSGVYISVYYLLVLILLVVVAG